jgi:hypothetical protein
LCLRLWMAMLLLLLSFSCSIQQTSAGMQNTETQTLRGRENHQNGKGKDQFWNPQAPRTSPLGRENLLGKETLMGKYDPWEGKVAPPLDWARWSSMSVCLSDNTPNSDDYSSLSHIIIPIRKIIVWVYPITSGV